MGTPRTNATKTNSGASIVFPFSGRHSFPDRNQSGTPRRAVASWNNSTGCVFFMLFNA
jgi:hypothetical protein